MVKKMKKYFYEETGMYIDWKQLNRLPEIDTLIDIGVGADGTPDLYERFNDKALVLIDPLEEAEIFFNKHMSDHNALFFKTALGDKTDNVTINVEDEIGRSTILNVTDINFENDPVDRPVISIKKLDDVVDNLKLGNIGIKIDTEGYELKIIRGANKTLKNTKFVIAEVRHNHESFDGVYKLHEFVREMQENGFLLSMILTAKPFIADLCFERLNELSN